MCFLDFAIDVFLSYYKIFSGSVSHFLTRNSQQDITIIDGTMLGLQIYDIERLCVERSRVAAENVGNPPPEMGKIVVEI